MSLSVSRASVLTVALLAAVLPARATQWILVLHPGGTDWQIQEAEKITFNGKDKLRAGSAQNLNLPADQYKKLPATPIAGMLRINAGGYLVRKDGGRWSPVAPDGANVKGSTSFAALWSAATVVTQKDKNAKSGASLRPADVFAILPGSDRNSAVVEFLSDAANFSGVGEKDATAAFDERMSLLVAVAPGITGAPSTKLQQLLLVEMDSTNQKLSSGIAHVSDLQHGLQYVAVSEKAYPNDDRQKKARAALTEKMDWLNQRVAILKAFNAGERWDGFVDKYGDFERWDNSYEDIRKLREKAFQESTRQHLAEGKRLRDAKQFELALQELKLAALRDPSNKEVSGLVEATGVDAGHTEKRCRPVDKTTTTYSIVTRRLALSDAAIRSGKLGDANDALTEAEALEKNDPRIVLDRAKWYQANKEPLKALTTLDGYDRLACTPEETSDGDVLRTTISYELKSTKETLKATIDKAEADGDYVLALSSAQTGLGLDPGDLDFLRHGGFDSAILRKLDDAGKLLNQYLKLSQTPSSNAKQRTEVYNSLPLITPTLQEPGGKPNWFSGYNLPANVFYDPISLMANAHPAEVKASRKMTTEFEWKDGVLGAVHTTTQQPGEKGYDVYFDYFKGGKGVRRVSSEPFSDAKDELPTPRFTVAGMVGTGKGSYTGLANHPVVDPIMIRRLTGRNVAVIVAGNPYFHPFVWSGVYVFLAEYDDRGRVKSARLLTTGDQHPHTFDFQWDGWQLGSIAERPSSGETGNYHRTMSYTGGKLTGEVISFGGRNSKVEYKYKGDDLVEAHFDDDPSLDSRNRTVTFR